MTPNVGGEGSPELAGIAITLDTYSHVIPSLQAEAAAVLDEAFPVSGG